MNKILENEIFSNTTIKSVQFKNQEEMNNYYNNYHNFLLAGIIFENDNDLHYTIRVNGTSAPDPSVEPIINYGEGRFASENSISNADIYMAVFSPIQAAVDQAILQLKTNNDAITVNYALGKLGKAASEYYEKDASAYIAAYVATIFYASIVMVAMNIVKEKELKIKDGLLMAGIHSSVFWLSWLFLYAIIMLISSLIITLIFFVFKIFPHINIFIQFLSIYLYGLSCCSLGFICSTLFKKSKTAGVSTGVIALFLCYSNFAMSYMSVNFRKVMSLISSPMTIGSFIFDANKMKMKYLHLSFSNILNTDPGVFFFILIFNNVAYLLLAIVLDRIMTNGFRFHSNKKDQQIMKKIVHHDKEKDHSSSEKDIQEDFNSLNNEKYMVDVHHVHKLFYRKNHSNVDDSKKNSNTNNYFLAVNDVNFKVYENEIFGILGRINLKI